MKICELNEHCGECPVIDYCTDPYCDPQLCAIEELANIEAEKYVKIAKTITDGEIHEKLKHYKGKDICWDDVYKGVICDIVCEKVMRGGDIDE